MESFEIFEKGTLLLRSLYWLIYTTNHNVNINHNNNDDNNNDDDNNENWTTNHKIQWWLPKTRCLSSMHQYASLSTFSTTPVLFVIKKINKRSRGWEEERREERNRKREKGKETKRKITSNMPQRSLCLPLFYPWKRVWSVNVYSQRYWKHEECCIQHLSFSPLFTSKKDTKK